MANSEPAMDILDGSDIDEDNVGDVDVDQENVLLESDDEEAHPSHQYSKSTGSASFGRSKVTRNSEEEEDVLNLVLQDEEILDYDGDDNEDGVDSQRLPPVKIRNQGVSNSLRAPSHLGESHEPIAANFDDNTGDDGGAYNDDNFEDKQIADDDDYDDEETETRTRSRFTTERNVDNNRASGGHSSGSSSSSSIQTIQTLGEHKTRPNMMSDGRPRHWNHNNGPRQGGPPRPNGPRHPGGRGHRFPAPRLGPPGESQHMRPNMLNPPIVQFSEGLFTDFNQPLRHPHQGPGQRPRQPLPGGPPPRNPDPNALRHPHPIPSPMNNNMRPPFPPQGSQQRPFFPPQENQMGHPPRMQPPGPPGGNMNMGHSPLQPGPRQPYPQAFNMRGQRPPPRFPPNPMHANQRNARPPFNNLQNMPRPDRPPFPPRQQRPPFRPDMSPHHDPVGMPSHQRLHHPHQQGYPPQHPNHGGLPPPGGFMPPHPHHQHPPRFMGPPGAGPPGEGSHNPYYMQQQHGGGPGNFNHPEQPPFQPEASWHGHPDYIHHTPGAPPNANHPSHWLHHQHQHHPQQAAPPHHQQPNYNGIGGPAYNNPNAPYEQAPRPPAHLPNQVGGPQAAASPIAAALQNSLDNPPITGKSIYIKPNSEIYDALTKGGHFRHLKEEDHRRIESGGGSGSTGGHGSSSSKRYDDYEHDHHHEDHHHYHDKDRERDRERSSGSAGSSRRRDRDDDEYYDDRRKSSYDHHHYDDRDRRPRRKYEEESRDRRHRSDSPDKKLSRPENYERERVREREREPIRKEDDKLLEEAKKMGLGEDYVKKLEEQRKLRERILKTKEQRRKQVKVPEDQNSKTTSSFALQKACVENEADSTVATSKGGGSGGGTSSASGGGGKTRKVLRIVRDKSGKVISRKVHVVVVGKPQQEGHQSTSTA